MLLILAGTVDQVQREVEIDKYPDSCPLCHHGILPKFTGQAWVNYNRVELVFQCPRDKCQRFFISIYQSRFDSRGYFYSHSTPVNPVAPDFPEHVSSISPMFCTIFSQAQNAERRDWKLIAGPGYRKALEFLVKDYLCRLRPESADEIKTMLLGSCIDMFIDNENIKQMAKRAAWLGNDECP